MGYKVAIDMCFFFNNHAGGKDEVAYNLLRGFDEIGVSDEIVCFCYIKLVPIISKVNSNVKIQVVPRIRTARHFREFHFRFRSRYEELWCKKHGIKLLLFPNKPSPNRQYDIKTCMIAHDIHVFEHNRLPGVSYSQEHYDKFTRVVKENFKFRDHIIAISDFDKSEMEKFIPEYCRKVTRIYNPIRFTENKLNDRLQKRYITVLNIQWLHKNYFTVLRAFREIMNETDLDLILVGNFPKNINEIKTFISENGMEARVILTGYVSDERLQEIISQTRIYVNASYFEGFGMTAVEMMGNKVPTIVAESTAMPEVTMGLCRYYSPTGDSHALAEVMREEINNPMDDATLEAASQKVREQYNIKKIATEYWEFFNRCIEEE